MYLQMAKAVNVSISMCVLRKSSKGDDNTPEEWTFLFHHLTSDSFLPREDVRGFHIAFVLMIMYNRLSFIIIITEPMILRCD